MSREEFGASVLAFLEAVNSRPEGVSQILTDLDLVKYLSEKTKACGKSASNHMLADRWSTAARDLRDLELQSEIILSKIEDLAANGHKGRIRKILKSLPLALRSEAAGRALIYMVNPESRDFAEELLDMGADCTVKLARGSTALMYASMEGNLTLIRKLLDRGADIHSREAFAGGRTAIEMAGTPLIRKYLEKIAAREHGK